MSDELERRLREAGRHLPGPSDSETLLARSRVLPVPARWPYSRGRWLALALTAAVVIGSAFGVGYAVAAGKVSAGKTVTKTRIVERKAPLDAGPGFLPAVGWNTSLSGAGTAEPTARATSANGVRIEARFDEASTGRGLPQRLLPLRPDRTHHAQARPPTTAAPPSRNGQSR